MPIFPDSHTVQQYESFVCSNSNFAQNTQTPNRSYNSIPNSYSSYPEYNSNKDGSYHYSPNQINSSCFNQPFMLYHGYHSYSLPAIAKSPVNEYPVYNSCQNYYGDYDSCSYPTTPEYFPHTHYSNDYFPEYFNSETVQNSYASSVYQSPSTQIPTPQYHVSGAYDYNLNHQCYNSYHNSNNVSYETKSNSYRYIQ